jgi:uncharacterized delta-60 repeat protein
MTAPSVSIDGLTATLTWTAPASNGYPITGYLILPVPAIGSLGNIIIPSGSTLTTTISGLDVSTGYAFKILAKNALGNGTLSGYSSTVYTGNVPSTPVAPTVAPASVSTATVSWSAPAANNSPITGYTIAVTPSAGVTVTQPVGTAMSTTVSGLAAGTAYAFTVTATNAVGNSAASPSGSYTHPGSPGAPQALSATSGSGTASLVWTAPSTDGGSAITAYRIQYATNSAFTTGVVAIDTVSATLGQTIGGLTNGTLYYFRVAALNAIGAGTWTATSSGTPVAPTGVTDTTFATAGVLALTPVATAATYGPDGKLYVATAGAAQDNFYVTRYTSAGVVDTTYGTNGVASAGGNGGLGTTAYPRSLLIDKAGRAVVAGMCFYSYNAGAQASACVARFTTAGARDTAFATYGWTTLNFNGAKYSDAFQILIQSTGKIVAGGPGKETTAANAPIAACMTRLLDNGTVDTTFGTSGLTCTRPGSSYFGGTNAANFSSMALGPNDVIAVGSTFQLANIVPIVSKFTANGAYDTSFNGGYITDLGGAPYVQSVKVAFQSTGKIVFAVNSGNASTNNIVSLGRYTTAGVMDSTFSGQGVFFANGGTYNLSSYAENFLLTVEGGTDKIVFAQSEGGTEKVRRYSAAGVVDTTFGTSGILALPGTAAQSAGSVAVNPQGYYTFVGSGLVRVK